MATRRGFTIIELIVVVIVVSIVARIAFVAYNNTQARSRDALRKSDLATLAKQIQIYAVHNKTWTPVCGDDTGTMSGYTTLDYATYPTISECLKTFDSTSKQLNDPSGCTSMAADFPVDAAGSACKTTYRSAYKAYNTGNHFYLATRLEAETNQLTDYTDAHIGALKTTMLNTGFNYVLKVR